MATRKGAYRYWLRVGTHGDGLFALLALPVMLLLLAFILPLVMVVSKALSEGVSSALAVGRDPLFLESTGRTVVMATVVTLICLLLGTVYAIGLVIVGNRLRVVLIAALLLSFWLSILVRTYGWLLLLQPNGVLEKLMEPLGLRVELFHTTPGMYPPMVNVMLPFMVLPIYASILRVDPQLLRAGQTLGASAALMVRRVLLPQLFPGMVAGAVIVFITSLAFFVTPAFIGGPSSFTISMLIERTFRGSFDFAGASAMGSMLLVATLLVYALADRYLRIGNFWGA